jgi:hypothetical protein
MTDIAANATTTAAFEGTRDIFGRVRDAND